MAAKANIKKVLYHTPFAKSVELTVASENQDGTANLADATGKVVVKSCPASTEPKHGHFTVGTVEPETKTNIETE